MCLKEAADRLDINYSTAKTIIQTFRKEGRLAKKEKKKMWSRKATRKQKVLQKYLKRADIDKILGNIVEGEGKRRKIREEEEIREEYREATSRVLYERSLSRWSRYISKDMGTNVWEKDFDVVECPVFGVIADTTPDEHLRMLGGYVESIISEEIASEEIAPEEIASEEIASEGIAPERSSLSTASTPLLSPITPSTCSILPHQNYLHSPLSLHTPPFKTQTRLPSFHSFCSTVSLRALRYPTHINTSQYYNSHSTPSEFHYLHQIPSNTAPPLSTSHQLQNLDRK